METKKNHTRLRAMVIASFFVALDIVFTRFFSFTFEGTERFSLQFLATATCAALLGPLWGTLGAIAGDILGMLINSAGLAYFPGFTLTAALRGWVYGIALHQKGPISFKRVFLTEVCIAIFLNLGLNSLWLSMFYGKAFWVLLTGKFFVKLVVTPIMAYILYTVLKALQKRKLMP